jgi:hypothetical protein
MDAFKLASKLKLRVTTGRGPLSPEQLWDLSLEELDTLAVALEAEHNQSGRKSFLHRASPKDKIAKLKFDVVLEILATKVEEADEALRAKEDKAHNQKIDQLIAEKKDESLKGLSIKELESMRR